MRYPKHLKTGDTIGLVAPAFGCTESPYLDCLKSAEDRFIKRGYNISEGPNVHKADGIGISSSPENCGKELTDYYCSQDNQVLISCGGGEMMCRSIEHVDFDRVRSAEPKWFMGYSDNTNFTFLLNTLCDVAAIYGPNVGAFGAQPMHQSVEDALQLLEGQKYEFVGYDKFEMESLKSLETPLAPYNCTEEKKLVLYNGNQEADIISGFNGRLAGGCLDCLANLVGTRYDRVEEFNEKYGQEGIVWFLEACDLNPMSIQRAIWNLDMAGWFRCASGFIIGRPLAAWQQDMMGMNQYNAVVDILGKYDVPIVMDADLGHRPPAIPIISGAYSNITVENNNIKVKFNLS